MKKLTIQEMHRLTPEAFHDAEKLPFVVVLDNVRSQHNIGAVFRTADAFLLEKIYLCGICCCPPNAEIHKTALGAEETVAWQHFDDTLEAVHSLQAQGYIVYAIEQAHDSITLEQAEETIRAFFHQLESDRHSNEVTGSNSPKVQSPKGIAVVRYAVRGECAPAKVQSPKGIAVVLGHEVFGVQQSVVDAADGCIEIPQYGTKHSLNVSVTAGIVLYTLSTAMR